MLAQPDTQSSLQAESCFYPDRSATGLTVRETNPAVLLFRTEPT